MVQQSQFLELSLGIRVQLQLSYEVIVCEEQQVLEDAYTTSCKFLHVKNLSPIIDNYTCNTRKVGGLTLQFQFL